MTNHRAGQPCRVHLLTCVSSLVPQPTVHTQPTHPPTHPAFPARPARPSSPRPPGPARPPSPARPAAPARQATGGTPIFQSPPRRPTGGTPIFSLFFAYFLPIFHLVFCLFFTYFLPIFCLVFTYFRPGPAQQPPNRNYCKNCCVFTIFQRKCRFRLTFFSTCLRTSLAK